MAIYQSTYPIPRPENAKPIGFEHDYFDADAAAKATKLSHGQSVAIGSLIELAQVGVASNDFAPYNKMKAYLKNMGMPTDYEELEKFGVTREIFLTIMEGSIRQNGQSGRKTIMIPAITNSDGTFASEKAGQLLDRALGAQP